VEKRGSNQFGDFSIQREVDAHMKNYHTYQLMRHGESEGDRTDVLGHLSVIRHPAHTFWMYPAKPGSDRLLGDAASTAYAPHASHEGYGTQWARNANPFAGPDENTQLPLFRGRDNPAWNKVEVMEMTQSARAMAPTMLGVAQAQSIRETGRGLTASTDLSEHSSRMTRRLQESGHVPADVEVKATNSMDWIRPYRGTVNREAEVPISTVLEGRQLMRGVVKEGRPKDPNRQVKGQRSLF
jgi:hypothetical protein